MVVSFYTTRVTLQILGVDDYGTYNLIAGVIALLSFVYTVLESSIQRFLNFELGKNNLELLKTIFSTSVLTMAALSVIVIIFAEIIGYFGIPCLNIPEQRFDTAMIVFHVSLIQFCIGLVRAPYNATIIAHERMDFYAYLSIFEALIKLGAVYLLYILPGDKLLLYATTQAAVVFLVLIAYISYCRFAFEETALSIPQDTKILKQILSFSGWSLFGSVASVAVNQGIGILLNLFGSVAVVAAVGICNQVNGAINLFVTNFQVAFKPQVVKLYAQEKFADLNLLINRASKFSFFLIAIISIPLMFCLDEALRIWLGSYPEHTNTFCCLRFVLLIISTIQAPLWMYVQATGKIKKYQLTISLINIMNLPMAYIGLQSGLPYEIVYIAEILVYLLMYMYRIYYVRINYSFPVTEYLRKVLCPIGLIILTSIVPSLLCYTYMNGTAKVIIPTTLSITLTLLSVVIFGLDNSEKHLLVSTTKSKLRKIHTMHYSVL